MTLNEAAKKGITPLEAMEYKTLKAKFLPMMLADFNTELKALFLDKRFLTCKKYAEYYGVHPVTIAKRTDWLRKHGIAVGIGKDTRYDKTYRPDGTRLKPFEM